MNRCQLGSDTTERPIPSIAVFLWRQQIPASGDPGGETGAEKESNQTEEEEEVRRQALTPGVHPARFVRGESDHVVDRRAHNCRVLSSTRMARVEPPRLYATRADDYDE